MSVQATVQTQTTKPTDAQVTHGLLQRAAVDSFPVSEVPPIVHEVLRSPGRPLDGKTRAFMEPRFGHDFSGVRVHTDVKAAKSTQAVNALAYTVGQDVVFGAGQYDPRKSTGQRLLAHELTHVVQQGKSNNTIQHKLAISFIDNRDEREADNISGRIVANLPVSTASLATVKPSVQRACGPREIGSVSGCTGRGGDITDFGGSSDRIFLFERKCDDFRPGEEARLRRVAATIGPLDRVDVDGFASEEGDPGFNEELSCARAQAVAQTLLREGVAGSITLYSHGATPGGREDRRSAVITITAPPAQIQPKTIIVIGSPSPDQAYGFQFVNAALCHSNDANTIWLVEHSGYEMIYGTNPTFITDQAPAGGYGWITPSKNLVGWINSMPDRSIGRLVVYSHGVPGLVALRYGWTDAGMPDYGLNLQDVARVSPNKFTPNATIEFNSCNTGTTTRQGNIAQSFANQASHPVRAWTGRTSYAGINRGTCRVQGSRYTLSTDAIKEFWSRWRAGTTPQLRVFTPQGGATQ
ncbi:MAG: DUF4157 domain-containing protein [Anaerolineales bacterium]|jgi:outer membrane protein OmpA-like peptidoglycan-associated protein